MEKNQLLQAIADSHGTPCYVYFADEAYERINAIRKRFEGRFEISYAVKSNPNPALLDRFRQRVEMLDISSVGELRRALTVKWASEKISLTGPGTRPD